MGKILIIKLGAMGDVIRTTPLLHVLNGDIFWVTKAESLPLLPKECINYLVEIERAESLKEILFDLVICLDDEYEAAVLATSLNKRNLIGAYLQDGILTYTNSSAEWFDMGLISRFGKDKADAIKMKNTKSYQEIIFRMVGKEFNGEEYVLNLNGVVKNPKNKDGVVIGIESRAGDRWIMKQWNKYDELSNLLKKEGYEVRFFQERKHISEYIQDINDCDVVVSGDTLAMHIALALKKKVVSILTCTSPAEIFEYDRMLKVVSPLLNQAFYRKD